jgi:multidrug efflux pump subunit AcrA (membrane-fusion protein)
MITRTERMGLVLGSLLMTLGCSMAPTPATNPDAVRQHADKAFQQLKAQEHAQQSGNSQSFTQASTLGDTTANLAPSVEKGVQIPFAEIGPSDGEYIRATGYGNLARGLYLCQHSADLAARIELSKLVRVKVTERSTDRIRERTGKEAEQDIEVVREGLVDEVLSDVRIVDRKVDKAAGTCSSVAMIPKQNLFPTPSGPDTKTSGPQ